VQVIAMSHVQHDEAALTTCRIGIARNGYRPVPVFGPHLHIKSAGKRPGLEKWIEICAAANERTIESWSRLRDCTNTGILTGSSGGGIAAIDIDVLMKIVAAKIRDLAREMLGESPLWRIGKAPKVLGLYRASEGFRKLKTPIFVMPDGTEAAVEVMAEGQQIVAFGTHPDTGRPYEWIDASPLNTQVRNLPMIDREDAEAFIAAAEGMLRDHGGVIKQAAKTAKSNPASAGTGTAKIMVAGGNFFSNVNAAALANLELWVPGVFGGKARHQPGTNAWRVRSDDLGRQLEEDISLHPQGCRDFGLDKPLSPIDIVMEHGGAANALEAAKWLCDRLRIDPATLGWNPPRSKAAASGDAAKLAYAVAQRQDAKSEPATQPGIRIVAGELPRIVDEAEAALLAAEAPVFQRGSVLVSVGRTVIKTRNKEIVGPRIVPMTTHSVVENMTKSTRFMKWDARVDGWVNTDCPAKIAETYLARSQWRLRPLAGIVEAPTMRHDGSILDRPGYDPASGLMLIGQVDMPRIPDHPTEAQARAALETLRKPIAGFPFVSEADRAVALSGMLTAVTRRAYGSAPLHAMTAPTAGSGKGKVVDVISVIATGRPAPVLSPGKTEEEAEKRLGSALISGDPVISIDNLEQPLGGELLCTCLTQPIMKIRILGQSLNVEVPSIAAMFATGNNLTVIGDMTRRTLVCTLDPGCERPELREFDFDPVEMVAQDRGRYIAAVLTILRAYVVAGFPDKPRALGSFEDWSDHIRGALLWLGEADPIATMELTRESDPKLAALRAVIGSWADILGHDEQVTASTLIKAASRTAQFSVPPEYEHEDLREVLLTIAGVGGAISSRSLGKWLKGSCGRIVNGMRIIVCHDDGHNATRYRLEKVDKL
jgi:putative DNA primase/helicase